MKYLVCSLLSAIIFTGCTCEDPPFLIPGNSCDSTLPYIVYPPDLLLINKDIDLNEANQELITIVFSEPMDPTSISLNKNVQIFISQTQETPSGDLQWQDPKTLVFVLNEPLPESCIEGCEIVLFIGDDPEIFNEVEEVLDADCDNEQGGTQFSSFFFF